MAASHYPGHVGQVDRAQLEQWGPQRKGRELPLSPFLLSELRPPVGTCQHLFHQLDSKGLLHQPEAKVWVLFPSWGTRLTCSQEPHCHPSSLPDTVASETETMPTPGRLCPASPLRHPPMPLLCTAYSPGALFPSNQAFWF